MFGNTNSMGGMNYPKNNSNQQNVTTKIRTFYGNISCLQLSYWNENISIKINPLKMVSPEGIREYDYDAKAISAITGDKATALAELATKEILPVMEKVKSGEITSLENSINIGVSVGTKGGHIYLIYKNDENGIPYAYLTLYTTSTPDGKPDENNSYSYKFEKIQVTVTNGENSKTEISESEFLFVLNKFANLNNICGDVAHAENVNNAFQSNKSNYSRQNNAPQPTPAPTNSYSAPVSPFDASMFPIA